MMNKKITIALTVIVTIQLACGPTIQVVNNTQDTVRLSITNKNQNLNITSSPGEENTLDVNVDSYRAAAIPSDIWMESMKAEEAIISQMIANPETMTEKDVHTLADRINRLYENEQQLFENASDKATCANSVDSDFNGRIEINGSADTNLSINCTRVKNSDNQP